MPALDAPSSEVVGADSEFPPAITTQGLIEGLTHLLELLSQELAELARHTIGRRGSQALAAVAVVTSATGQQAGARCN